MQFNSPSINGKTENKNSTKTRPPFSHNAAFKERLYLPAALLL